MSKEQAVALNQIRRLAGLDPDGPRVPMQPYLTDAQKWTGIRDEQNKHLRDAYLVNALRFT
jgi:hypothetical protein